MEAGVARPQDDLPGDPGHDIIQHSIADQDHAPGGTTPQQDRPREPIRVVEYQDGTRLAYRDATHQRHHEATTSVLEDHGSVTRTCESQSKRTCLTPQPTP